VGQQHTERIRTVKWADATDGLPFLCFDRPHLARLHVLPVATLRHALCSDAMSRPPRLSRRVARLPFQRTALPVLYNIWWEAAASAVFASVLGGDRLSSPFTRRPVKARERPPQCVDKAATLSKSERRPANALNRPLKFARGRDRLCRVMTHYDRLC